MKANVATIRFVLKRLSLKAMVVKTKHPMFKRMYIYDAEGCQIGRFTIYNGLYSHSKWYSGYTNVNRIQAEGWEYFVKYGKIL